MSIGKTLGVIGTGQIGREVITRAHAFGLRTIAWSRSLTPEKAQQLGVERCDSLDDVFRQADIVTLHLALKPDTRKLVNAARLALLKPNAILINTARGEVVDQAALRAALQGGKLRAGLDVFDPEPAEATADFNDPILDLPNLYGTHHIGASTEQAQEAIAEEAIRIIQTFVKTGVVLNCVNLATRTPAKWQLVVRHYDRVGVLAFVMDQIRRGGHQHRGGPERHLRRRGGGQLPHPARCRAGGRAARLRSRRGTRTSWAWSCCGWGMGCSPHSQAHEADGKGERVRA